MMRIPKFKLGVSQVIAIAIIAVALGDIFRGTIVKMVEIFQQSTGEFWDFLLSVLEYWLKTIG